MTSAKDWAKLGAGAPGPRTQISAGTLHAVGGEASTVNDPAGTPFTDSGFQMTQPDTLTQQMMTRFQMGDVVRHSRSRRVYVILDIPENWLVLERTGEGAYIYRDATGKDMRRWIRSRAEMEDGRFVLYRPAPTAPSKR